MIMEKKDNSFVWVMIVLPIAVIGALYQFISGLSAIPAILMDLVKLSPIAIVLGVLWMLRKK